MTVRKTMYTGLLTIAALGLAAVTAACGSGERGETEEQPTVAVRVGSVARTTVRSYVTSWGYVEPQQATRAEPPASARIAALVPGLVAEVHCAEGQRVAKGDLLFQLDTRVADVAVDRARQAVRYAEVNFEREKMMGPGEATSQRSYEQAQQALVDARSQLQNAEAQRELLSVRAPLAATVVRVAVAPGDTVDLTRVLAEVVDLDRLVVSARVRSTDAAKVKAGHVVEMWIEPEEIGAPAPGATLYPSQVVFVGAEVDRATDTVTVRTSVPSNAGFRPGQFVNLRIVVEERRDRLTVPDASIVTRGGSSEIAVVEGDRAVLRPVQVGLRDGGRVEIEGEGIVEGTTVVTEGAYGLPQETRIRVIGD